MKLSTNELIRLIDKSHELTKSLPDIHELTASRHRRTLTPGTSPAEAKTFLKYAYGDGLMNDWHIAQLMAEGRLFSEPIHDIERVRSDILHLNDVLGNRTFDEVTINRNPPQRSAKSVQELNVPEFLAYIDLPEPPHDPKTFAMEIGEETARLVERLSIIESGRPQSSILGRAAISYGISSFGYDVRLGTVFKTYGGMQTGAGVIDPLNFDSSTLATMTAEFNYDTGRYKPIVLPPHAYCLSSTQETFVMPSDAIAICLGKSTYARSGVIVNVTPIEPGFIGQVTLEIVNVSSLPVYLYPGQGICQFLVLAGDAPECSYATRSGKYQFQTGVTPPRANRHS